MRSKMPEADNVDSASNDEDGVATTAAGLAPPKKKQKRNKPTLSCSECVDRKTKVSLTLPFRASPANQSSSAVRPREAGLSRLCEKR